MKINWSYIKLVVLVGLAFFLFAFSAKRNKARKVTGIDVNFEVGDNLFITANSVDKLLIQNNQGLTGQGKEILALSKLEDVLDNHPMIAQADVYVTVDGVVGAKVKQRKPLARIQGAKPFYIDMQGEVMPLSSNYSARVPIVSGVTKDNLKEIYPLLTYIEKDDFIKEQVIGIHRDKKGKYSLHLRVVEYTIQLGEVRDIQAKFNNYKAFYKKALKDTSLEQYQRIDLRYKGQVVGTKK